MARIHFLNVKDGDCSIIQHDNGHVTMIDICNASDIQEQIADESSTLLEKGYSSGGIKGNFHQREKPTNPIEYLHSLGNPAIFRYIQTHPDMDHMDGLAALHRNSKIYNFWDTNNNKQIEWHAPIEGGYKQEDWVCYQQLRVSVENPKALFFEDGACEKYFAKDDSNNLKQDDYLEILSPTSQLITTANNSGDWNDSSYVILYHIDGKKILFCGDAGNRTIAHLLESHLEAITNIDVLIAPHHGRDSLKDYSFLNIMNPKVTLFGNADSKDKANDKWNNRGLFHISNSSAGDVLIEIENNQIAFFASCQSYVQAYRVSKHAYDLPLHGKFPNMFFMFALTK